MWGAPVGYILGLQGLFRVKWNKSYTRNQVHVVSFGAVKTSGAVESA